MRRRARTAGPTRRANPARRAGPTRPAGPERQASRDYDFDYAGTTGELDQNEYGGDLHGGGRYGRGPFEQSQRYGENGFAARTGAYGSLQRQFESRYASGGYSGLKTSGRALGGPPGAGSTPSQRAKLPRTGGASPPKRRGAAERAASEAAADRSAPAKPRAAKSATARSGGSRAAAGPVAANSAGRAPLRRSDSRIQRAICERLSQPLERFAASDFTSEHLDVSDVTVSVAGGKVTLEGTVPERRMKHYIEDLVDACPGVQDIDNRIRVRR